MQDHRQPGRPIFALSFYGKLVAVAILIGSNGFVVGMNRSSLNRCLEKNNIRQDELADLASWPEVKDWLCCEWHCTNCSNATPFLSPP
ncbi:hypothetical protein I7I53_00002 [Histoplasma capsulatum var. duboisii H88]|uniref:Uncharacterized protein n=1 Tax=Ajellomyces capsulatus (strain H88) TaxID=544711 RepID=A0A8A1LHC5_AJEC8|nr:hypothetical protein I7I53_00002 [Histoplasma capsulatum var. duboisii H88]